MTRSLTRPKAAALAALAAVGSSSPLLTDVLVGGGLPTLVLLSAIVAIGWLALPPLPALPRGADAWLSAVCLAFGLTTCFGPTLSHLPMLTMAALDLALFGAIAARSGDGRRRWQIASLAVAGLGLLAGALDPALPAAPWSLLGARSPDTATLATIAVLALLVLSALRDLPGRSRATAYSLWLVGSVVAAIALGRAHEMPAHVASLALAAPALGYGLVRAGTACATPGRHLLDQTALTGLALLGGPIAWHLSLTALLPCLWATQLLGRRKPILHNLAAVAIFGIAYLAAPPLPTKALDGLWLGLCGAGVVVRLAWPSLRDAGRGA